MSTSYKTNLEHLPQRLPVRLRWKDNKVIRAVFIRDDYYLYLQREEDEKPKNMFHVWNSYLKHHVPKTDSNIKPVDPRRIWNVLDLLDLIIYEDPGRLDGQDEPSLKTILTTYAPECIKLLRSAPPEPEPVIPQERIEQERKQLLGFTSVPQTIEVGHFGAFLKATLMPDGTFTYGSRKGLNSFQLLHIYRMDYDPMFYSVEHILTWTSTLDLLYVEGGSCGSSLSNRIRAKVAPAPAPAPAKVEPVPAKVELVPAKVEPVPAKVELVPAKVEPVPVKQESFLTILLKTLEEREAALKATKEALLTKERERLLAIREAHARIAQLEADIAQLEKTLA
jgi:hypothetical protein